MIYILIAASIAVFFMVVFKVNGEPRRKMLHIIAFMTVPVMCATTEHWYIVSGTALLFAIVIYPILIIFEKYPIYKRLFQERNTGEIKKSLFLLFGTEALLAAVFWGCFHSEMIVVTSIVMWGIGDLTAALFGKKFGKHHIPKPFSDGRKTVEGSVGMFIVSTLAGILCFHLYGVHSVILPLISSLFGTAAEAITRGGYDTVSVPFTIAVVLLAMTALI